MFNIAITGGIASGKSTIAKLFKTKNICVIDTDELALQLTSSNKTVLAKISEHFGKSILNNNQLDRPQLANIIFNNTDEKKWLEQLLHPLIFKALTSKLQQCASPYTLSLVPLLQETSSQNKFDHVLVIDCDRETQISRLLTRNGLNTHDAALRINAQTTAIQRLNIANDVISNNKNTTLIDLNQAVNTLHAKFLRLSANNLG